MELDYSTIYTIVILISLSIITFIIYSLSKIIRFLEDISIKINKIEDDIREIKRESSYITSNTYQLNNINNKLNKLDID